MATVTGRVTETDLDRFNEVGFSASIVIPAHMEEGALPRQLASVLSQELDRYRLQVVVVVNGSTASGCDPSALEISLCGPRDQPLIGKSEALDRHPEDLATGRRTGVLL